MSRLEWVIGLRYALVGRGDRFVSFSSLASVIGMALGVAALIVVMSVMNGFHLSLRERILAYSSHVEIANLANIETAPWPELVATVESDARVVAAAPVINRQAMLAAGKNVRGVQVQGVLPEQEAEVSQLVDSAELAVLTAGSFNIVLGTRLAAALNVAVGDRLILLAPTGFQTLGGLLPRFRNVNVSGVIDTGLHTYNEGVAFMHFDDAAKMFSAKGADGVRARIKDVMQAPQVAKDLAKELNITIYDWTSSNATFFNALAVERRVMFVILTLIIAVAVFQIVAALVTMVRSKRSAIAILRTIGMAPAAVMRVFLIQGMLVGMLGIVLGLVAGLLIAVNLQTIVGTIEQMLGTKFFPGEVYLLETVPVRIVPIDVIITVLVAFVLTALATIFPALAASRIDPAEVLRHE